MVWIVLAFCALVALVAFVVEEIRAAPEVDDSFEVHLRDLYRAKASAARQQPAKEDQPRDTDAA